MTQPFESQAEPGPTQTSLLLPPLSDEDGEEGVR